MNNRKKTPRLILVGGQSRSGKTEASRQLADNLGNDKTLVIHLDDFYLDLNEIEDVEERGRFNFDEPDAIDKEFLNRVITAILKKEKVMAPLHDYKLHTRKPELHEIDAAEAEHIIVEGLFALHPDLYLLDRADVTVYMDTDDDTCAARRFRSDQLDWGRSVETVFEQYTNLVKPMRDEHVKPTIKNADVIIKNNAGLQPVFDYLAWLDKDEITIVKEKVGHVQTTLTGWFGTFATGATQMLVSAGHKLGEYLGEEEGQDDVTAPGPNQV